MCKCKKDETVIENPLSPGRLTMSYFSSCERARRRKNPNRFQRDGRKYKLPSACVSSVCIAPPQSTAMIREKIKPGKEKKRTKKYKSSKFGFCCSCSPLLLRFPQILKKKYILIKNGKSLTCKAQIHPGGVVFVSMSAVRKREKLKR